jgi:hypothetical protein
MIQESGGKLPQGAIARLEEIEIVVIQGAHNAIGFCGGPAQYRGRNALVDGAAEMGIGNGGIKHRVGQFAKQVDLFVGGIGHDLSEVL